MQILNHECKIFREDIVIGWKYLNPNNILDIHILYVCTQLCQISLYGNLP